MERRAFLPKLALLVGAVAVACREAVTAPFTSASPRSVRDSDQPYFMRLKDGTHAPANAAARRWIADNPGSFSPASGPIMALQDCQEICMKWCNENDKCGGCCMYPLNGPCNCSCCG